MSLIRDNLMTREGYTPYCGNDSCSHGTPRTHYIQKQFQCGCGWRSGFDIEFIRQYETKWASSVSRPNGETP